MNPEFQEMIPALGIRIVLYTEMPTWCVRTISVDMIVDYKQKPPGGESLTQVRLQGGHQQKTGDSFTPLRQFDSDC